MDRVPDRIGEVVAFRCWHVRTSRIRPPVLLSLTNGTAWPHNDWLHAECAALGDDNVPHEYDPRRDGPCTCGIYAAVDRRQLSEHWHYNRFDGVVLGEVGLAGKIIPGTKAYRAEKARPLRLWLPYVAWELAEPLEQRYGVPVELTNPMETEPPILRS